MSNKAMSVAIGIVGAGLLSIGLGLGNGNTTAFAASAVSTTTSSVGPTVVWFGVPSEQGGGYSVPDRHVVYHRLWSDGRIQMRYGGTMNGCQITGANCDWIDVPAEPSGGGEACAADINSDLEIGIEDLLIVVDQWGTDVTCEPSYDCLDLGNVLPSS